MLEIENTIRHYRCKYNHRIQHMEERISGIEVALGKIDSLIKENVKATIPNTKYSGNMGHCEKAKRKGTRYRRSKEIQLKGTENLLNKIIEENFSNLKKDMPVKETEAYRTPNRVEHKICSLTP